MLPFLTACASEGRLRILSELDAVAVASPSLGVKARVLACIADVLGSLAGDNGLRSGPGRNPKFMVGLRMFERQQYNDGIVDLAR